MHGTLNLVFLQTLMVLKSHQSEGKHDKLISKQSLQIGPFCDAMQGSQRTGHSFSNRSQVNL